MALIIYKQRKESRKVWIQREVENVENVENVEENRNINEF